MTPKEFSDLRRWMLSRWPTSRIWNSDDNAAELFQDFAHLPIKAVDTVVRNAYFDGAKHIPTPGEIISAAREHVRKSQQEITYQQPCSELEGGHPWAILEYGSDWTGEFGDVPAPPRVDDTWRWVQCARCGDGPRWRQVLTPGEIEDMAKEKAKT